MKFLFLLDDLKSAIELDFGSIENLKIQMSTASIAVQGSGWGWLGYNRQSGRLQIAICPNQDPLEATTGKNSHLLIYHTVLTLFINELSLESCL